MSADDKTYLSERGVAQDKPAAPLQISPGTVLKGTYRIDAELGSGGMGTVYRATHLGLEKIMAVKVLSHRAISTPDSLARFEREAKVAGKVSHPAMTAVIDFGVEGGTPYIVMEYVSGAELAELIERHGALSPRRAVAVMRQIVSLLRAAHALGIVHRDLKPANIKIIQETPEDSQIFVKVLDFGVAKVVGDISGQLTSEGMLVGTPAYMAPEQITGQPIDGRTDLYAAGLIFHEMLSGKRAFKGETIARILHAQMNEPPPPLTAAVPDIVRQTLQKFCEKRPEDRFQDAAEADRALTACEDVLRPPSVNVAAGAVLPAAGVAAPEAEPQEIGVKTALYRPPKAGPGEPDSKPSSAVAISDSLVREGRMAQQEPPLVSAPVSAPAPAPASPPVPGPVPATPRTAGPPHASGGSKAVVLLGVAFVLILAGIAASVWAWKSSKPSGPEPIAAQPPSNPAPATPPPPAEPPRNEAPTEPVARVDTPAPPAEEAPVEDSPTEPAPEPAREPEDEPQEPQAGPEETAPPPERLEPGCYVAMVEFESSRLTEGRYTAWVPVSVTSRTSVKCSAVPRQANISQSQGVFDNWPEAEWGKPLHYSPRTFQVEKKGDPNTRRLVARIHSRVSAASP